MRVHAACPFCGAKVRKIDAYDIATTAVRRTCKCRRRLSIIITPVIADDTGDHEPVTRLTVTIGRMVYGPV